MINSGNHNEFNTAVDNMQELEVIHEKNVNPQVLELHHNEVETIKESFNNLIGNMQYEPLTIDEVRINSQEEFLKQQHQFLTGYYIAIDYMPKTLRIVTENKTAYVIDLEKIPIECWKIIFKVHLPRKICLNSNVLLSAGVETINGLYDLTHIIRMFYGICESDLKKIVCLFKPDADDNNNALLYNLHDIKNALNTIIERHGFFPLVNKEFKLLQIIAHCEGVGLPFSETAYKEFLKDINEKYNKNKEIFNTVYESEYTGKEALLKGFKNKGKLTVLNEKFLQKTGDYSSLGFAVVHRIFNQHNNHKLNFRGDRLYVKYNPYNSYGMIESDFEFNRLHLSFLTTTTPKYYITGTYEDLFFRIFASATRKDYILEWTNNSCLMANLAEKVFGEQYFENKDLYEFYTSSYLLGFMQGYFDPIDMMYYFYDELDFFMKAEEVASLNELFAQKCSDLLDFIYNFKPVLSKDKRYSLSDNMPLFTYIKLTETDIFKHALLLINESVENYNSKNKYKIKIVGLLHDGFILEADEGAYNIALDIVNRNLTKAFNRYVKNVSALCNVSTGYKAIRS